MYAVYDIEVGCGELGIFTMLMSVNFASNLELFVVFYHFFLLDSVELNLYETLWITSRGDYNGCEIE